jgi:hypothetical protein
VDRYDNRFGLIDILGARSDGSKKRLDANHSRVAKHAPGMPERPGS